jgi:H+-transporting ATPase
MLTGLTSEEARRRLASVGPNTMPDTAMHPLRRALAKFWAPVPWMLEAAIVLQLVLGKDVEAAIIAGLLAFNAVLGLFQEGRAQATLAALKSRLALSASVRRDGAWQTVPAADLVPGDVVKLSLGGVVAADMHLTEGSVLLDQSMLTGESVPSEAGPGVAAYAGTLVRRGEAVAEVTATGARTKFGRTAELVRTAHVVSSQQKAVLGVVRNLAMCNGVLIVLLVIYAAARLKMPLAELIPLVLTAVLASIPVALPATFTLAAAIGARALAKLGVLPTRLSAVDEAGTMDVLCVDKTGTLTRNELVVSSVRPLPGFDEGRVLVLAALASSDGGQDPVDAALRAAASGKDQAKAPHLVKFVPFDPATKMSEASATDAGGGAQRIVKGAFAVVSALAPPAATACAAAQELEERGERVLAVAAGPPQALKLAGLIALSDPPRADSATLVSELHGLGVRVVMVTGDAPATAAIVARAVGLTGAVCPPGPIPAARPEEFAVFAGVVPEDKYQLVKAFQQGGHHVGMCGDGANDAPALRQAQIGIAVLTATDVAKSAAGMVLTTPGLAGIIAAVNQGRITFQRILSYTLNSITKKVVQVMFLAAGLIMTGHAILSPMLMVLIMMAGDFLGMSLTTDRVRASPQPNAWRIGRVTAAGVVMGLGELVFCLALLAFGLYHLRYDLATLRTLAFIAVVFGNQATTYTNRERRHLWTSRPSLWLVASSVADVLIASLLAISGVAMAPLPVLVVVGALVVAMAFAVTLDMVKVPVFARLGIAGSHPAHIDTLARSILHRQSAQDPRICPHRYSGSESNLSDSQ